MNVFLQDELLSWESIVNRGTNAVAGGARNPRILNSEARIDCDEKNGL